MDSTQSCDNGSTTVTALSVIHPETGMTAPVGLLLTDGKSQVMYEAGLKTLESALAQLPAKWGGTSGPRYATLLRRAAPILLILMGSCAYPICEATDG